MMRAPRPAIRLAITILAVGLFALPGAVVPVQVAAASSLTSAGASGYSPVAVGAAVSSRHGLRATPRAVTASAQTYLYTCFWRNQAVTLTPVRTVRVEKLVDARLAGNCRRFDTADPRFRALVGKSVKVYRAPAEFKTALVAYKSRRAKSNPSGTWTFSATAVIVKKTTAVLSTSTVMDIKPPVAGQPLDTTAHDLSLTFRASDPQVKGLKPGSVIVSGVTALTPYGMMRKVIAVTTRSNVVTVDTVPAQLSDVFNEATIDIHTALTQALRAALVTRARGPIHYDRLTDRLSLCPSFPTIAVSSDGVQSGESSGGLGAVMLGGSLCITAGDLQYQEYVSRVRPQFAWTFDGGENLHVTYKLEGGVVAYHGDVVKFLDQDVGLIPLEEFGVPVEIVPHISSALTADLNLSGYVSGGFSYTGTYAAGLSCGVTGCTPTGTSDGGFSSDKTLSGGSASFTIALGISLKFLIDGVFGPGIGASVYATATAAGGEMNCLSLVAGAKATVTLNFQLFGKYKWVGSWDVIKVEKPIAMSTSTCAPKIASFKADQPSPQPVGQNVTFTAKASRAVDEGSFHITIVDALTNRTVQDCATGDTCAYVHTEAAAKQLTLRAEVTDSQGAILDTSGPVVMSWEASSLELTVSPERQNFAIGHSATLTLQSDRGADGTTTFLKIVGSDGSTVATCNTGTSCEGKATSNAVGTVTYTGEIVDGTGKQLSTVTLTLNWIQFRVTATLSNVASDVVPVGKTVSVGLGATPDVPGYTLSITGGGGTYHCPSLSGCMASVHSDTAQQVSYSVQVTDDSTGDVVSDVVTQQVTWIDFTLTVSANPGTTVAAGTQVTISMSASPDDPDYTMAISGGGGSYTCSALSLCSSVVQSSTPQSVTYTVDIKDKATGTTRASQQITISWQGASPCPGGAAACMLLNPMSGDPNSTFTATWFDQNAPNATATFTFDGSAFNGSSVQMDAGGKATLSIKLSGATAGAHTVGVTDSAGGNGSNTYTVTGGGGGTCGGISISMTADNASPPAGSSATLSVTGPTLPAGCQVKIEDPGNGYVYNTCSGTDPSSGFCYVAVPYTDFYGYTGCSVQGQSGQSCSYQAYVLPTGDSNRNDASSSSAVVTITWQ
ncbi:MAG TPA: hypothetical protein VKX16_16455 [Chloroflexota bacterium]|nr:hypothetical protein [Chloroflexota bacterium]